MHMGGRHPHPRTHTRPGSICRYIFAAPAAAAAHSAAPSTQFGCPASLGIRVLCKLAHSPVFALKHLHIKYSLASTIPLTILTKVNRLTLLA